MGLPSSRFIPLLRLVFLPPLVLLTLTCLYTSSSLRPFNVRHHLSFGQDVQCFSCESSSFSSRSFLSLANFPASSYIRDVVLRHNALKLEDSRREARDVVLRHNALKLEDSRREATSQPITRRDTNEVESVSLKGRSENAPGDVDPHPDTTSGRVKEEVSHPVTEKETSAASVIAQEGSLGRKPIQHERREEIPLVREERTHASPSDQTLAENSEVRKSASIDNAAPLEEKIDHSLQASENKVVDPVVLRDKNVHSSVPDEKIVDSSHQAVELPAGKTENSDGSRKEDSYVVKSIPEEKNVVRSIQVVEVSTETKENIEGGTRVDADSSVSEDKIVDSSVEAMQLSKESKENSGGVRKEDVDSSKEIVEASKEAKESFDVSPKDQLENRHLTSDDRNRPEKHVNAQTDVVRESTVEQSTTPAIKEDVMRFRHDNMSKEVTIAGIAVQNLMHKITKSALPIQKGVLPPDSDDEVSLLLLGGSPQGVPLPEGRSCEGRHVFVYNLPSKFNVDLVGQCDTLLRWFNFCDYFMNEGMGTNVPTDVLNDRDEKVLVPDGSWFLTHQYALELIFHARLKHYPCLTTDVNQADLFFVPYYAGLDVIRWHFQPNVSNNQRDELTQELMTWLESQETWSRNNGFDHVFVLGKISWDFRRSSENGHWGSKLLTLPSMKSPTKLLIERDPWHNNDAGVPHPTFFHPKDDNEIRTWLAHVEQADRRYFVSFAGMPRPKMQHNVRGHLIQQCLDNQEDCFLLRCEKTICLRPDSTMNLFLHSHFCMQPPGDSPTRRSVFDSLIGGCIPVLFDPYTAYYQYPWHLPQNASSYSVFIPSQEVMSGGIDIVARLKSITPEERTAMRTRIIREIIPGLLYSQPGTKHSDFRDAFDISIEALLHRVANLRAEKERSTQRK